MGIGIFLSIKNFYFEKFNDIYAWVISTLITIIAISIALIVLIFITRSIGYHKVNANLLAESKTSKFFKILILVSLIIGIQTIFTLILIFVFGKPLFSSIEDLLGVSDEWGIGTFFLTFMASISIAWIPTYYACSYIVKKNKKLIISSGWHFVLWFKIVSLFALPPILFLLLFVALFLSPGFPVSSPLILILVLAIEFMLIAY